MTDNMKRLLEKMSADSALAARANGIGKDELIALAHELGLELTESDFESVADTGVDGDELEQITGGGACACAVGGGGTADDKCNACGCVIAGHGTFVDNCQRCACSIGGGVAN